ncbi:hypothetical protein [uncultured Methanobacterium sp.]|uniref:hypothetical protein n=1 Tax=uncultured Methanobacterium sp. TaxID=176306 RepID=UPI002AA879FB|nr:hypothetical protein [uncultured Methanobacterium sp.]
MEINKPHISFSFFKNPPSFIKDPYFKVMMVSGLIKSTVGTFLITIGGSILVYSWVQPGTYIWHAPYTAIALILIGVIIYFIGDLYKVIKQREENKKRAEEQQEQFLKTMEIVSELEELLCRDIIQIRGGCDQGPCKNGEYCHENLPELYTDITHQTPAAVIVKKAILVIENKKEQPTDGRILLELIRLNRDGVINKYQLRKAAEI